MSGILTLDNSYELWLTQSWSENNHGICGHTFEIIDYFYILSKHFKTGILISEDITWEDLEKAIYSKYDFSEKEIQHIKQNTVFFDRPKVVRGTNILIVDGGVLNMSKVAMLFDNIIYFACGNKEIKNNERNNVYVLQDDRVYDPVKINGINYKKRILFDRLKKIKTADNKVLVYGTKNCRNIKDFDELKKYGDLLVITNKENRPNNIPSVVPPVDNLFEMFSTYLYTPIERKWDCSPRFIAECKYYNKKVIYHNIDYMDIDHGLRIRKWDVDNDFYSLFLREDDELIEILKNIQRTKP